MVNFNSLGPVQYKYVYFVPSIGERKEVTHEQLSRGISKETSLVTFELIKIVQFTLHQQEFS